LKHGRNTAEAIANRQQLSAMPMAMLAALKSPGSLLFLNRFRD
jgi:hypothetical protein